MFSKLWTLLQTHYQQSDFKRKMGSSDGQTAQLWMHTMVNAGITNDDLLVIGKNLHRLKNPAFIPNVFQLIEISETVKEETQATLYPYRGLPNLPDEKEVMLVREKTKESRAAGLTKIKDILNGRSQRA